MLPSGTRTPLRPSDFSFYGFDDLLPHLGHALGDVGIRHGQPVAPLVEDAVFVPAMHLGGGEFEGALLTRDGQPIPTAQAQRRFGAFGDQIIGSLSQPVEVRPERVVDEEVVYLGWCYGHFGHLLLESLTRMWILDRIDSSTKVVFHIERPTDLMERTLRVLAAFGIPQDRILVLDGQTLLRRAVVPEALYEISWAAHERWAAPFRRAAASIIRDADPSDQPVYLSRRLLPSTHRPIVGEFELEEVLRENGFAVAHPETMTFEDQVRLVNWHRDLFTSAGSTAYLSLFAVRPPRLHVLTSGIPFQDYFLVPKAAGAEASYANCFAGENRPSLYHLPPLVEIDKLAGYLDSLGLLRTRLRASIAARVRDFRADYDEERLYADVRLQTRRGRLSTETEAEALLRARSSWPLSWGLACYSVLHDPGRVDPLVRQFAALVATESDVNRLARFHEHVERWLGRVLRQCSPDTAARLAEVLSDRFAIDPTGVPERRRARREAKLAQDPKSAAASTTE